ncbi:hypothetical protein Tco_1049340, partial [Tanacetum coccineum]
HLDWITVRRDDDKLYKLKEGNFNRLRIQDIEDMLLFLVQGKLTNLTIEERLAFNVSLRMFTRSIVIQRDKKNRLMHIDELHKFSNNTLNDVRTALDDRLKGIQMKAWRNLLVGDRMRETFDCCKGPYDLSYDVLIIIEHAEFDESNANVLERFYTSAGNPVKEILLKLNLPDHRLFKDGGGVKEFQRSFRHSDTERLSRSDEVLKLKNFKKDATLKLFKSTNQERYEHVGPEVTSYTRWQDSLR